jgi:hypothetical protein
MKKLVGFWAFCLVICQTAFSQVDTTFIYKTGLPYGTLDIRIAKSSTRYYYLQEGKTFSFRESSPGVKTNTYRDMTSWDSSPFSQGNLREKNGTSDAFVLNYRMLAPQNYDPNYSSGYPLIIMIHGAGERGNCWDNDCYWSDRNWRPTTNSPAAPTAATEELMNNDHNLLHGGQVHLAARNLAGTKLPNDPSMPTRAFPGFILFPQNLNGWDANNAQDVIRLIRLISKKYKIDPNKIYIHGLSNGGAGVFDIVKRAPWMFAAALTMSAISEAGIINYGLVPKIANIPLWMFQGGIDTNPTPGKTEGYIKKFREGGVSVRYTKYSNLGHGTWNSAYNEPDFFSWIRSKEKSDIHVFADNPTLCLTNGAGVKMDLAEGFFAYQWEKDGAIISGATSASYTATTTGTYRARFSRISKTPSASQWNQWSDPVTVTSSNPAKADVTQIGTVVLKDLNNYAYAQLSSTKTNDHYYWYKNGTLLDLPGTMDDTTRTVLLKQGDCTGDCTGNGDYTLVTASYNNCPSPASTPIHIFFNNQAPTNITAPTNFTGSATSATKATLNWQDASTNEGGFEIWRRKVTSPASKWVMATLTAKNVTSFGDSSLEPSSTYQYKIRAVSNAGRSNYTPSSSTQYLIITTQGDSQAPTAPQNLTASSTGIEKITLTWQAATDNTGIRSYNIYYGSTVVNTTKAVTKFTLSNLNLNTNYTFTVKAVDLGGNLSASSNAASANTYVTGLYYEHSTGGWSDLDQINWNIAEYSGHVNNFTLAPRTQEDYFNFEFDGFLYITTGGSYQFKVTSDDGSRLTLNDSVIVNNDGKHGNKTVTSALITLSGGPQAINVKYFEDAGGQSLTVQYKGPDTDGNWINIPDAALRSGNNTSSSLMTAQSIAEPDTVLDENVVTEMQGVTVFPNPIRSGNDFSLQIDALPDSPVRVTILDALGTSFYDNTFEAGQVTAGTELNTNGRLKKGIYLVIVNQGESTVKQRIIVKD